VGMWESRVLCEISKLLWKSFCDFHRSVISTAARLFVVTSFVVENRGCQSLGRQPIVVPGASYAVVREPIGGHEAPPRRFRIR
jgi:hypothetical protein